MLSTEPTDINPTPLIHILYAFADVQSDGTIILTDSYADEQVCKPSGAGHIWAFGIVVALNLKTDRNTSPETLGMSLGTTYTGA